MKKALLILGLLFGVGLLGNVYGGVSTESRETLVDVAEFASAVKSAFVQVDPPCNCGAEKPNLFYEFMKKNPDQIWPANLPQRTRQAVKDFASRKRLGNGLTYGEAVRKIDLRNKRLADIEKDAQALGFKKFICPFLDFKTMKPILDKSGKIIPIWAYVHPDGSKVRLKPNGDPVSKFRKKPDAKKSFLSPPDAEPCDYPSEMVAVDRAGNAIPKGPSELFNPYEGTSKSAQYIDDWAERAHTYIMPEADPQFVNQ